MSDTYTTCERLALNMVGSLFQIGNHIERTVEVPAKEASIRLSPRVPGAITMTWDWPQSSLNLALTFKKIERINSRGGTETMTTTPCPSYLHIGVALITGDTSWLNTLYAFGSILSRASLPQH